MRQFLCITVLAVCCVMCFCQDVSDTPTKVTCIDAPAARDKPAMPLRNRYHKHDTTNDVPAGGRKKRAVTCGAQPLMTSVQANEAVYSHNLFRSKEPSSNMLSMVWSNEMAAVAQAWANTCTWEHGMLYDCSGNIVGQNLYIESSTGGQFPYFNMTAASAAWAFERNYWNFATQTCNSGKVCGHWTQLVWGRTEFVGCAYKNCPTIKVGAATWTNALVVVCDYTIAGNVIGDPMYLTGTACSKCDSDALGHGYKCANNLCVQCTPSTDSTCKCGTPLSCLNGGTWSNAKCACVCPKAFYGNTCERPCSCEDQDPDNCAYWAEFCPIPEYSDFMYDNCVKTCKFNCVLPTSCY